MQVCSCSTPRRPVTANLMKCFSWGSWKESGRARSSKSIFYPASLLSQLDWPDSRVSLAGERAAFQDLMGLARRQVHLSTFELENDAIIGPSVFLEDAGRLGTRRARTTAY